MNIRVLSTPTFLLLFYFLFSTALLSGQESIRFKTQRATEEEELQLKDHFTEFTVATLGTEAISVLLRSRDYFSDLRLEFNNETYRFSLQARDLRAPNYILKARTATGNITLPRSPNKTYFGFTHEGQHDVRITADEDFFNGMIILDDDELYIEPLRNIIDGASKNKFVIYRASNNLKNMSLDACGVDDSHSSVVLPHQDHDAHDGERSSRACKTLQVALADDFRMFNKYGSVGEVEDHNLAVINNVETNYDFEFDDDLVFTVVEIFVATNDANDPWSNSNDIGDVLDDFTDWGPSGFDNVHDVAGLWSARNFIGDVIGLAWVGTVCTSNRYHVLEDFTNNANLLRVLQAHELGHNFNAFHDPAGSNTIMAPSVSNTNLWSAGSINSIDNYMNQINCLGPCTAPDPPVADFEADPTSGCEPLVVTFDDLSSNNPTTWNWTFEGGSPGTSTNQNPIVTYNNSGAFNVSLTVSNSLGSNSVTFFDYIVVGESPFADFDYTIDELTVDFDNQSTNATSYFWEFGDGETSTNTNPIHTYAEDGEYDVTLTAFNSCGEDSYTFTIEIITFPQAFFDSDITEGCAPFEVEFYNLSSSNAQYFSWSFPGGTPATSSLFEPIVLYENPGNYNVSLTAYNEAGEDIVTVINYITVNAEPVSEFDYTTNGLQVNFSSLGSEGDTFFWNFGDGHVSTNENPIHTYDASGVYQVTLTVSNECGTDVLQLSVSVTGAPDASFSSNVQYGCSPLLIQFTDQSGGSPTSFAWVFEGGIPATSSQENPLVTYQTPGLFDVQLTVTNSAGNDLILLPDYIEVEFPTVSAFNFSVAGQQATFVNQSTNAIGTTWNFGDGSESTSINPTHTYLSDGVYNVTLISAGICANDTSTQQVSIQTPPLAGFSYQSSGDCTPVSVAFINASSPNATSYAWSFPGGNPSISSEENPLVSYTNVGTYNVTLIAFSGGGSDTMTWDNFIALGDAPEAAFLLSTDETTVTLDNVSSDALSYEWFFGDGMTSTETNPVHTYSSFGIYTLTLIASNSCGNDTMEIVIELSTIPNAFFGYSAHTGCAPFEVSFIDQSQNNPSEWAWTFNGGDPAISNLQNPTVTYAIPGVYSVSLQATNSQGTDVLLLDGLIQVGGTPDATFSHLQTDNVVSLEYTGIDFDSLRWSFGDGRTDTSLNPTVEYNTSGQYQIFLIVFNPCGVDTSSLWVTIDLTRTNQPNENPSGWQIRPNPFKDVFTIYGQPLTSGEVLVSLMDVHGRLISSEFWGFTSGQASKVFGEGMLPSGLIIVVIQEQDTRTVLKALKQ